MYTKSIVSKTGKSYRLNPCQHCGQPIPRRVYDGKTERVTEGWETYSLKQYCSRECHSASCQPPPDRVCEYCGELLVRGEKEGLTDWKARKFCSRNCAAQHRSKLARKKRMAQGANKCTVPGCNNRKGEGLRFLCTYHYLNEDQVKELPQDSMMNAKNLLSSFFTAMEEPLRLMAATFSEAEYRQEELEFYKLMTPAQRAEIRRMYDD